MVKHDIKLFNDVNHVLKALNTIDSRESVRVEYKIFDLKANIFWPQNINRVSNGFEKYINWEVIDALKEVSDKRGISYRIGLTKNLELNIQIYVSL